MGVIKIYSVEFNTKPENGFIKIPEEYNKLNLKNLKVILIIDDEKNEEKDEIDKFFENYNFDLSSFKFNREEANER
ncbi:MAG: hypothetical protein BWY64_00203 [bacterium ADurb.Bin363]|nr:MAG: hypothetical protein BWY64_00203 [bacterium ADurb.Bin363]